VRFTVELVFGTLACVSPVKRPGPPHPDGVPQWWVRRDPQGRPWIPGSSLKGPIRSVLEALSRSCMSEFDHEAVFSWRPIAPASAGFLIREARGWVIQPADDIRALPRRQPPVSSSERWEGMAVDKGRGSLRLLYASDQPGARAYTGEWVITDVSEDSTKRWQRIFSVSGKAKLPVPDGVVHAADKAHAGQYEADDERLKQERPIRVRLGQITSTRDPRCPYKRMEVGERRPVWYRLGRHGRVSELGPVALFRRTFNDSDEKPLTLGMLLRRSELGGSGSYRRCEDPGLLCPACALFGTTTPAGEASGWQGRVRISPAWSDAPLDDDEPVVLRPAGKPHPSAQTFYLWDPDHPDDPTAAAFGNDNAVLRGRKFYWHRRDTTKDHVRVPDAQYRELKERGVLAKQLQAKELIPAGTRFTFEVDADGLSEVELGLLVLAIDPARLARLLGSPRKPLHKLGGGKPLGMGSARLTITTAVELRPEHRYTTRLLDGTDTVTHTGAELEETLDRWARAAIFQHRLTTQRDDVRALLAILDWNAVPDPELLSYPPGRDKPYESFQWFMEYAFKDRKTGRPIASREHRGPDPLRTVEEVAEHRRYQWRWPTTRPRT
jgi:CRISPR-associated protein (TIGR03986 family)